MAAVAEHRRLRLALDCLLRDVRASDLPLLEWFGTYAHLRRMEEATDGRRPGDVGPGRPRRS